MTTMKTLVTAALLLAAGCGLDGKAKNQCEVQTDCLAGYVCSNGMCIEEADQPDAPPSCTPITCGANQCEVIDDGCGGTVDCGACSGTGVCGLETPNECATPDMCVPESSGTLCAAQALTECGTTTVVDRCGATRNLDCGACTGNEQCGTWSHGLCDEIVCSAAGWCRVLGGSLAEDRHIRDLWANPTGELLAVGATSSDGRMLRFDGSEWKIEAQGAHDLRGVVELGSSRFAVTVGGKILKTASGAFTEVDSTSYAWTAVHAVSSADIWTAGQAGSGSGARAAVRHFDGSTWTTTTLGGTFDIGWYLTGITAAASNKVWAVGASVGNGSITDTPGGLVAAYDGVSWTVDRTLPSAQYLRAVWAQSATSVWAVGDAGTILYFNGTDWTQQASGVTQQLLAVAGAGDTVWAAGAGGVILKKVGSGAWTVQASGTSRAIYALWARSTTDVWAGGEAGLLLHYEP